MSSPAQSCSERPARGARRSCHFIALVDDHSRFLLGIRAVPTKEAVPILETLAEAIELCGVPLALMSDNGLPFVAVELEHDHLGLEYAAADVFPRDWSSLFARGMRDLLDDRNEGIPVDDAGLEEVHHPVSKCRAAVIDHGQEAGSGGPSRHVEARPLGGAPAALGCLVHHRTTKWYTDADTGRYTRAVGDDEAVDLFEEMALAVLGRRARDEPRMRHFEKLGWTLILIPLDLFGSRLEARLYMEMWLDLKPEELRTLRARRITMDGEPERTWWVTAVPRAVTKAMEEARTHLP